MQGTTSPPLYLTPCRDGSALILPCYSFLTQILPHVCGVKSRRAHNILTVRKKGHFPHFAIRSLDPNILLMHTPASPLWDTLRCAVPVGAWTHQWCAQK